MVLTERLCINSKAKNILFKMGKEGLLIHADDREGAMNSASRRDVASESLLIFSTNCCLYSEINNSIFF